MNRLENALQVRADEKNNGNEKKPSEKKKPKSSTCTDKPKAKAKAKSAAKKVSKSKSAPKKKPDKKATPKSKGEGKVNAVIPDSLKRKYRDGCSKCRHRKGCTPSCWAMRGYLSQTLIHF